MTFADYLVLTKRLQGHFAVVASGGVWDVLWSGELIRDRLVGSFGCGFRPTNELGVLYLKATDEAPAILKLRIRRIEKALFDWADGKPLAIPPWAYEIPR